MTMPITMQMMKLEQHAREYHRSNPDFDPQTIDYESEVDPTLSYSENLDNFSQKYSLREPTTEAQYEHRSGQDVGFQQRHQGNERGYERQDPYAGKSMMEIALMKVQRGETTRINNAPQESTIFFSRSQQQATRQQQKQPQKVPYQQQRQERRQRFKRFTSSVGIRGHSGRPFSGSGRKLGSFFRGRQERRPRQPQEGNPFFSNFRDFGQPHPLSFGMRIGAGSENDKKYIRNRFLW